MYLISRYDSHNLDYYKYVKGLIPFFLHDIDSNSRWRSLYIIFDDRHKILQNISDGFETHIYKPKMNSKFYFKM